MADRIQVYLVRRNGQVVYLDDTIPKISLQWTAIAGQWVWIPNYMVYGQHSKDTTISDFLYDMDVLVFGNFNFKFYLNFVFFLRPFKQLLMKRFEMWYVMVKMKISVHYENFWKEFSWIFKIENSLHTVSLSITFRNYFKIYLIYPKFSITI